MQQFGEYRILKKIAEGGMAIVYLGLQPSLSRRVAIKVLANELLTEQAVVKRFHRESLIIARLTHPNIIHVIDRGLMGGRPYFIMEYVEGTDLAEVIDEETYDTNRKLDVIIQVCKALAYAHRNGVIHRDIKPANILIDADRNVAVTDFGVAQLFDRDTKQGDLTEAGMIIGTPRYMSPEQQIGSPNITAASDLYSLGVIMYEWFTGVKPLGRFERPSEIDPTVPGEIEETILKCLEADPAKRIASADEIKDRLLEFLQGAHIRQDEKRDALQGMTALKERFALLDIIKDGREGAVYLFENKESRQLLVIKRVVGTQAGLREAKLFTSLKHANIAGIYGTSGNDAQFIIVMEYLAGGSLKDRLVKAWPLKAALEIARPICAGLSFAHKNRIIHGNLRPTNILFSGSGEVKVADFGLEEHYQADDAPPNWYRPQGEPGSVQADIFAVGVILYEMLIGARPEWRNGRLAPQEQFHRFPAALRSMMTRMLAHDPGERYRGFDEVISVIDGLPAEREAPAPEVARDAQDIAARKRGVFVLVSLLATVAALAAVYVWR